VCAAAQPPERPPAAPAPLSGLLGATRGSLLEAVLEQARELLASPQRATTHAPLGALPARMAPGFSRPAQAQRDAWPRIAELVEPLLSAPPGPLPDVAPPATLADADSRFVSLLGVDVHFKEERSNAGSETGAASSSTRGHDDSDGTVLLCLHGFNGSTFSFRDVLRPLARRGAPAGSVLRAVSYDRPPFGLSSRPRSSELPAGAPDPYSDAGAVALADALLTRLRARRVVVLGHSAGAAIALALARQLPRHTLAGIVLVSPAVPASSSPRDSFLGRADLGTWLRLAALRAVASSDSAGAAYVRRQTLRRAAEVRLSRDIGYARKTPAPLDAVDGYLLPLKAERWDEGTLAQLRAFSAGGAFSGATGPPKQGELDGVPILILQGEDDEITPVANARKLAEALGDACEYVELPRVGHLPMEEAPEAFNDAVAPWLQKAVQAADRPAAQTASGNGR